MRQPLVLPFVARLADNLKESPQFIQVVLGPRQVGKTTTIQHYLDEMCPYKSIYWSADKVFSGGAAWLLNVWQEARSHHQLIVIDEIQKIENWSEVIKKLWDEEKKRKKPMRCILLGSSSMDLHEGLSESLTGRFQLIQTFQWNFQESQEAYGLSFEDFLKFGGYPGSYSLIKNPENWAHYLKHSILETVIEKDILKNKKVKSPSLFKQAFEILLSTPAQEISYTKLLGQLQDKGNTEVVKYYIRLYEGAFLIKSLEKFSLSSLRKKTSSPKILPLCPAFIYLNYLSDYRPEERGRVFESLVGCVLNRLGLELYYWREGTSEVDFVLKRGRKLWAIEVKSGARKSASGIHWFLKKYPHAVARIITPENYMEFEKDPINFLDA